MREEYDRYLYLERGNNQQNEQIENEIEQKIIDWQKESTTLDKDIQIDNEGEEEEEYGTEEGENLNHENTTLQESESSGLGDSSDDNETLSINSILVTK